MFREDSPEYEDLLQMYDEAKEAAATERQERRKKVVKPSFVWSLPLSRILNWALLPLWCG